MCDFNTFYSGCMKKYIFLKLCTLTEPQVHYFSYFLYFFSGHIKFRVGYNFINEIGTTLGILYKIF